MGHETSWEVCVEVCVDIIDFFMYLSIVVLNL